MQGIPRFLLLGLLALLALTSCSKQPDQEISAARAAVDAAISEGGEKYSFAQAKTVNDELTAAINEVKVQDDKFFKDFGRAKEMLAKVKVDADNLKAGLAAKKEEARKNALAAADSATASIEEVRTLLTKVPKVIKAKADTDVLNEGIKNLDDAFLDVKKSIELEDYIVASENATVIKDKAAALSEQIKQALKKSEASPAIKKVTTAGKISKKNN
jgi:hypothetical protein